MATNSSGNRVNCRGIPTRILMGKDPRFRSVFFYYRSLLLQALFERLNASFWLRARKGTDESISYSKAAKWDKLKRYTLELKKKLEEEGKLNSYGVALNWYALEEGEDTELRYGEVSPRTASPEDRIKLNRSIREKRAQGFSKKDATTLSFQELGIDPTMDRSFAKLIGIRTGQLVAATAPGTVYNNRYIPVPNQTAIITDTYIQIGVDKVPHAKHFDAERPIIPTDLSGWIVDAHESIIEEVKTYYVSLLRSYRDRQKRIKDSSGKKAPARDSRGRYIRSTGGKSTGNSRTKTSRRPRSS